MSQLVESTTATRPKKPINRYGELSLRFWHGMRAGDFFRLLLRNRFRVRPARWPMVATVAAAGCLNSLLAGLQRLAYGRRIAATPLADPPIFIIGHWRSGTTYLHRLLVQDERHCYATTYECVAASHFLLSKGLLAQATGLLLPKRRPMDNMSIRFDNPLEDEFALVALGAPTMYYRMAFPNHPAPHLELLDMESVDAADLARFRRALIGFFKALTLAKGKRLVLKSPPHTGRVELLSELFPGARFVHITRHPYEIFPSMRRTWEALDEAQGFQRPHHRDLEQFIFDALNRMYGGFHRQRATLDPRQICDVRYDELVADPIGQVAAIYEHLGLDGFAELRPRLEAHVESQKSYQRAAYELDAGLKQRIYQHWREYFGTYGYEP